MLMSHVTAELLETSCDAGRIIVTARRPKLEEVDKLSDHLPHWVRRQGPSQFLISFLDSSVQEMFQPHLQRVLRVLRQEQFQELREYLWGPLIQGPTCDIQIPGSPRIQHTVLV